MLGFDHVSWKKGVEGGSGCCCLKKQTLITSIWFSKSMWPKSINNHAVIFWNNFITCLELTISNWRKVFSYFLQLDASLLSSLQIKRRICTFIVLWIFQSNFFGRLLSSYCIFFFSIDRWQIAFLTPCAPFSARASMCICNRLEGHTRL